MIEWLKTLCSREHYHVKGPWAVVLSDVRYIGATNGWGLALVRSDAYPELPACPVDPRTVLPTDKGVRRDFASLREFVRAGRTRNETCPGCKGAKIVECTSRCWNPDTEQPHGKHWTSCDGCNGTGIKREEYRPGVIRKAAFNLNLLDDYLGDLTADTVILRGATTEEEPISIECEAWRVVVMPMRTGFEGLPVLEAA